MPEMQETDTTTAVPDITVIIRTHDEACHIESCIRFVQPVATRVLLADSVSMGGVEALGGLASSTSSRVRCSTSCRASVAAVS